MARRWLRLGPLELQHRATPDEPTEVELISIRHDPDKLREIRSRLSDISWWMRLLCQRIAQRANREGEEEGKFWQSRYRAVRLLDESAILACAAYVSLNPIRSALAETLEDSEHTSAQRRVQAMCREESQAKPASDWSCDESSGGDASDRRPALS